MLSLHPQDVVVAAPIKQEGLFKILHDILFRQRASDLSIGAQLSRRGRRRMTRLEWTDLKILLEHPCLPTVIVFRVEFAVCCHFKRIGVRKVGSKGVGVVE